MNTAEKILSALEATRLANGYYREVGAAVAVTTVETPDFASVGSTEGDAQAMAFMPEQSEVIA